MGMMYHRMFLCCSSAILFLASSCNGQPPIGVDPNSGAMVSSDGSDTTIAQRFAPPTGFTRSVEMADGFGYFLRHLALEPAGTGVHLYNGSLKGRQDVHAAVIDMTVGEKDLQQCADAVMRLRAEYFFALDRFDDIHFRFTDGTLTNFGQWAQGTRYRVGGPHGTRAYITGVQGRSHGDLMNYLEVVFTYAGTLSLSKELALDASSSLSIGDVFIKGGSPGHAVIVVDKALSADGRTAFLLAQSYMPAQQIHVLKNTRQPELGAWFMLEEHDRLYTPEWTFDWADRRRWP